uniref:MULE transposase domain-containing protein n=1 Tax=Scylla olivacea TaxID=85551 RepID=A0A0P4VXK8_SCYOL
MWMQLLRQSSNHFSSCGASSFIRQGDNMKQVPLVYVLMSRRSKDDYTKILDYIMERISSNLVKRVVIDFESAVWGAFQRVKPNVTLTGCCFHWTQAVWKKINELGLAPSYCRKKNTSRFLCQPSVSSILTSRADTIYLQ